MHYLYRTYYGKERKVAAFLTERGQDVFLPMLEDSPLFPTYMFVNEDGIDFYELNRTPGGIGVVVFGTAAKIPNSHIDKLKETEWVRSEECGPGSKVIITSGPFNHMQAVVKARKADRIIVFMNILHSTQELSFPLKDVEAA